MPEIKTNEKQADLWLLVSFSTCQQDKIRLNVWMLLSLCEHDVTSSNVFGLNQPLKALAGTSTPISFFFWSIFLADAAVCKESTFSAACRVVPTLSTLSFL